MQMMRCTFSISISGKSLVMADTLSRATFLGAIKKRFLSGEVEAYVHAVLECLPATERRLEEIRQHQEEDKVLQQIVPVWI